MLYHIPKGHVWVRWVLTAHVCVLTGGPGGIYSLEELHVFPHSYTTPSGTVPLTCLPCPSVELNSSYFGKSIVHTEVHKSQVFRTLAGWKFTGGLDSFSLPIFNPLAYLHRTILLRVLLHLSCDVLFPTLPRGSSRAVLCHSGPRRALHTACPRSLKSKSPSLTITKQPGGSVFTHLDPPLSSCTRSLFNNFPVGSPVSVTTNVWEQTG